MIQLVQIKETIEWLPIETTNLEPFNSIILADKSEINAVKSNVSV